MLLSDMLGGVTKTGFFEEVKFWTLVKTRISIVFIGVQQLHWLFILGDSQFVQFFNQLFLLLRLMLLVLMLTSRRGMLIPVGVLFATTFIETASSTTLVVWMTPSCIMIVMLVIVFMISSISTSPSSPLTSSSSFTPTGLILILRRYPAISFTTVLISLLIIVVSTSLLA